MSELPSLKYNVPEEQPPYNTETNYRLFTKLYIHNIDFNLTDESLLRVFNQYGTIKSFKKTLGPDGKPRGFAHITYINHDDAANALRFC